LSFLIELDAIRQPDRLNHFLAACEADSRGRTGFENRSLPEAARLLSALKAALSVDAGAIASAHDEPERIKLAVFEARLDAIKRLM
jgi:tRNA nucleotidyltransferase (CCA-adding enzyme)